MGNELSDKTTEKQETQNERNKGSEHTETPNKREHEFNMTVSLVRSALYTFQSGYTTVAIITILHYCYSPYNLPTNPYVVVIVTAFR